MADTVDLQSALEACHPTIQAFKAAVDADDFDAVRALLAADCVFTSPVVFKPYDAPGMAAGLLTAAGLVFDGSLTYERVLHDDDGAALVFRAKVGDRDVHGTDFITLDDQGLINHFMVMLRPMSGMHAMAEAMQAKLTELGVL